MKSYLNRPATVEIARMWDGAADVTGEVARLEVLFPDFESHEFSQAVFWSWSVQAAVRAELQELVNQRLGSLSIEVQEVEIRTGSLTIGMVLVAAFVFVKDFPKFREGLRQLAEDLKLASEKIIATLRRSASQEEEEERRRQEAKRSTRTQTSGR